jgi:hypothetical protein
MGLLKGQDEMMNDGDCLGIINKIFAKQLQECVNLIDEWRGRSVISFHGYYGSGSGYRSIMYHIERSITYMTYESIKAKLYDFVNHYELTYEDMNKLHRKYFVACDPYTMTLNDSRIVTVDYENTVDYLSRQYQITDVLGSIKLTLTEYQNWAYLVNAFRSFDIVFNQEFIQMQKEFLMNALKEYYNIN